MDGFISDNLVGESQPMRALAQRIPIVARARRTTLISGPTGSGKEVVAAELHRVSYGGAAPYVKVHCGALPESLVEAELFGHTRGAFTGAASSRAGLIRSASGGTLFLDEVDSLSTVVQTKLLRFLESGEFRSVGSDASEHADVWVIAATNRDLRERVDRGEFREDLLYRLDVMHLRVPPLHLREADIELLARHFLARCAPRPLEFTESAMAALRAHDWPGNVRELKHRIERAAWMTERAWIDVDDLELPAARTEAGSTSRHEDIELALWHLIERDGLSLGQAVAYCERKLIEAALRSESNNRTRAAQRLGIHVRTIFKKLNR